MFKPRLLRETAEIALTEIKRFIEPKITEEFSLRRVSAPLYLSVESGMNDPGPAVRFTLEGDGEEVAVVRGLNRWLRSQLVRYDIAAGFGVFTVMNALRPEVLSTATASPHLSAWAWQQVVDTEHQTAETLIDVAKRIYSIFLLTEARILEILPHLEATLPQRLHVVESQRIAEVDRGADPERAEYLYHRENQHRALLIIDEPTLSARIVVWNNVVRRPLTVAEIAIDLSGNVASVGGNILRDPLAMQILHQPHLLN